MNSRLFGLVGLVANIGEKNRFYPTQNNEISLPAGTYSVTSSPGANTKR